MRTNLGDTVLDAATDSAFPTARPAHESGRAPRFRVLGPLEVLKDGVDHAPTTPKILQLLAVLLTRPNKITHLDTIVSELWDDDPPRSVRKTIHTYVHHLRRTIQAGRLADDPEHLLVTRAPGYLLRVAPEHVDVSTFQRHHNAGRDLIRDHRYAEAAREFHRALSLWNGTPLDNVHCGPVLSTYVVDLVEQQRDAQHLWIEAKIHSGEHRGLIGELRTLTTNNPLDETLHAQLIRALARSGRRSDAMAAYRMLRSRLNDELGVEPADEIQVLHHQLLTEGELKP